jgi:hypothetical protein
MHILSKLQHLHKINVTDLSQGIAMSSYEAEVPKIFTKEQALNYHVIQANESYFSNIKSFETWYQPSKGMKAKLEEHLQLFRDSQMERISQISSSSPLYQVAVMSVSDSISSITNLIRFMEITYQTYVRAKYSNKKARHITTRLTKRTICKIAKPRHDIMEAFKAGEPSHIGKLIFMHL